MGILTKAGGNMQRKKTITIILLIIDPTVFLSISCIIISNLV